MCQINGICLQIAYKNKRVHLLKTYKSNNTENQCNMATFKTMVRYKRADGFYQVYIRVLHHSKSGYLKTDKFVTDKQLTKSKEIKDAVVNSYCAQEILHYTKMLNDKDISNFTVAEVIDYLQNAEMEVNFSEFATKFINKMAAEGHERNAKNYRLAVDHLQRYLGTTSIMFSRLTTTTLNKWIDSLSLTNRAKEMYPTCVRQIFKKALIELNDEERGVIPIKFNPWMKINIPKSDTSEKKAISAEACREFFNRPLPESKMAYPTPELGRDVALLSLCLGGINTVDLYLLKKEDYQNGIISYKRAKTRHSRKDEAYIEMRVEPFIKSTFEKYLSTDSADEYLFIFHNRYRSSDSFNANVNGGIRKICIDMNMKQEWGNDYSDEDFFSLQESANELGMLYKDVDGIIKNNVEFFEQIRFVKSIYVLGLSISDVDFPYIRYINSIINSNKVHWEFSWFSESDKNRIYDVTKELDIRNFTLIRLDDLKK